MDYASAGARSTAGNTPATGATLIGKNESLPMVVATLDKEIERISGLHSSLMNLADRLCGSRPQPASDPEVTAPSHSIIDELQRKRRRLSDMISACEVERDRIGQALS